MLQKKFLLQDVSETDESLNNFERERNNNCSKPSIFYLQVFKLVAFCRLSETLGKQFPLDKKTMSLKSMGFGSDKQVPIRFPFGGKLIQSYS